MEKSREEFLAEIDCAYADAKKRGEEFDLSQFGLTEEERKLIERNWLYTKMLLDARKRTPQLFKRETDLIAQIKEKKKKHR